MRIISLILVLFIMSLLLFTGCDGFFTDPCLDKPDSMHCYQNLAVERSNPSYCAKIDSTPGYKKSNPAKDKCYMMVAEKTQDAKYCRLMEGGEGSYEKSECATNVATDSKNPLACQILSGKDKKACLQATGDLLTGDDISKASSELSDKEAELRKDPGNEFLKDEVEKLRTKKNSMYDYAPADVKRDFFRKERERIFEGIDDADVRSAIVKDYTDFRKDNKDASIDELLKQMEQIKEEKETMKRLDEEANKLIDDMKNNVIQYGTDKATGAVEDIGKKAWEWTWKEGSDDMKWRMSKLERLKDTYDKGSAAYTAINDKIEKFKKVYDEVNEVYGKIEEVNGLLASGKIDQGKAKVLKGGVMLGKGLEYATSYVPVFGSTMSTVTKETFGAAMKLAKKRAQRSTALEKCFDDPLNCDTDEISAY